MNDRKFLAVAIPWHVTDREMASRVRAYMPRGYRVVGFIDADETARTYPGRHVLVSGHDDAGWSLDGYVIPRLMSGGYAAHQVTL